MWGATLFELIQFLRSKGQQIYTDLADAIEQFPTEVPDQVPYAEVLQETEKEIFANFENITQEEVDTAMKLIHPERQVSRAGRKDYEI